MLFFALFRHQNIIIHLLLNTYWMHGRVSLFRNHQDFCLVTVTLATWNGFIEVLKSQFGNTNIEIQQRGILETITQEQQSVTDYGNQFRLMSTEANWNDQSL